MTDKPIAPRIALSVASNALLTIFFVPVVDFAAKYGATIFFIALAILLSIQALVLRVVWGRGLWRFMWRFIIWSDR